jgi:glycosyltransferase involved in cell wall biosynthesis
VRIAQVAPLYESVPPRLYGGTERVVSYLTEELVRQGHHVTLFASGDSVTSARLVPCSPRSLRQDEGCRDPLARHFLLLEEVFAAAAQFDVLHFHIDFLHFPLSRRVTVPTLTTLHGRLDLPDLALLYREYREMPLVAISDAQRSVLPAAAWHGTVHHGVSDRLLGYRKGHGGYLAFLGRISPEKRLDRAIEIARRAGRRLLVAAKVDRADAEYFEKEIEPLLSDPHVTFLGEIGESEKNEFLGGAAALLFPIDWPEPFGLVLIEAMACGTPVIAYRGGSVEEIVSPGETGFIVSNLDEAVEAVARLGEIDRRHCRRVFEKCFTAGRMARDYTRLYAELLEPKVVPFVSRAALKASEAPSGAAPSR